ncbi:MAG: NADPH-dependent FMN reductase [Spirochaetae bacterium HGW-Spirochaetae-3]|nr:MAG: NADPH-dependent FMN reductase [Spirochaetae bacterium HGW-Spirochaetae-3]
MSKKILVLSGSPRSGGNSDTLCDRFIDGAAGAGNSIEKINIQGKSIRCCTACYACKGKGACVQEDDMAEILDRMVHADVIVLATPVYFYSMDGQMKTLIDRTLPRYTEIKDKDLYFIVTAAAEKESMERTVDGLRGFSDCLPGSKVKGVVYGAGAWQLGDIQGNEALREAYELGVRA